MILGNEEPVERTALRAVSSFTGMTDAQITADTVKAHNMWDVYRNQCVFLNTDEVPSMEELDQLIAKHKPDIVGIDHKKIKIAKDLGIESFASKNNSDSISWFNQITNNSGVDGVLITAATESNNPLDIASQICRKRGRIIMVGVTGNNLRRDLFYKKELTFQVSCSYGPGRYDKSYEELSNDYPIAYVRWTEKRNFEAILDSLQKNSLKVKDLISHSFSFLDITKIDLFSVFL